MIPTLNWDETLPPDTGEERSIGASRITNFKTQFREIFEVDHEMESSGSGDNWGKHNKITFDMSTTSYYEPSAVTNAIILWSRISADSEPGLLYINENSEKQQIVAKGEFVGGIIGEIRMWYGLLADIPVGWSLCDGSYIFSIGEYLPNLLGKFIRGSDTAGSIGGSNSNTVVEANLPAHTHTTNTNTGHYHGIPTGYASGPLSVRYAKPNWLRNQIYKTQISGVVGNSDGYHTHTVGYTGSTGSGVVYDKRPSYFELAYIIKRY